MARITVEDCIDKFPSRFELVLVASQRTRKLYSGEEPTVEKNNDKNTVISLREIADETISINEMKESLIEEYQTVTITDEENENLEFDLLKEEESDTETDTDQDIEQTEDPGQQIEEEIKNLSSAEDSDLEKSYEISSDLQPTEIASSSENDEQEADA